MLSRENISQIVFGVIGSIIATGAVLLLQKTVSLEFWQLICLLLFLICVVLIANIYRISRRKAACCDNRFSLVVEDKPDIAKLISSCSKSFKFLGISSKRTMSSPAVQAKLIELGREKGEIKILLLNPDSKFLIERARDEGESPSAWMSEIRATIERLKALAEREHINIELKLYDQYPIWRIANFDDKEMSVHFFLKDQQGPQSQLLRIWKDDNDLFNALELEFERLWDESIDA